MQQEARSQASCSSSLPLPPLQAQGAALLPPLPHLLRLRREVSWLQELALLAQAVAASEPAHRDRHRS